MTTERESAVRDPRLLLRDAGATAVAVIVSLMNDSENKPELRLKAAESILDRACGKTALSLFDGGEGGAIRFEGELEAWSR